MRNELCHSWKKNCTMDTRYGPSRSKCKFDQQLQVIEQGCLSITRFRVAVVDFIGSGSP